MTTLLWIGIIYMITILISFPFINKATKRIEERKPHLFNIFNRMFLTKIIAYIPLVNLWLAVPLIKSWIVLNFIGWKLERKFKNHPNKELRKQIKNIAQGIRDLNKPEND